MPPTDEITPDNSVPVPFRAGAPGVIDLTRLRARLAAKAPNAGGSLEPNEFALQMLRFPYRQVFGDPDDRDEAGDKQFYDLAKFRVTIALDAWKSTVAERVGRIEP